MWWWCQKGAAAALILAKNINGRLFAAFWCRHAGCGIIVLLRGAFAKVERALARKG
jgi:hypothetical protein